MKKLVFLGDSIRLMGYGYQVAELLSDEYETWQPGDNCRFAAYTLRMCFDQRENIKDADIIHYNCGLWDMCDLFGDGAFTPMEDYVALMVRITKVLRSLAPNATLIFATTTPPSPKMWGHDIERIKAYNKAVVDALTPMGVLIDDLFSVIYGDIDAMICEDLIHPGEFGKVALTQQVSAFIRATQKN